MTNATGYKLTCFKNGYEKEKIMSLKRGRVDLFGAFKNRTEFSVTAGTLKIINVERNDKGTYNVESFDYDGKRERDIPFTLQVQGKFKFLEPNFSTYSYNFLKFSFYILITEKITLKYNPWYIITDISILIMQYYYASSH